MHKGTTIMSAIEIFVREFSQYLEKNNSGFLSNSFRAPYQITVLNEIYNHRVLMIVKHDPNEPSQKITVLESNNLSETFDKVDSSILSDQYWVKTENIITLAGDLSEALRVPLPDCKGKPHCLSTHYLNYKNKPDSPDVLFKFFLDLGTMSAKELLKEMGFINEPESDTIKEQNGNIQTLDIDDNSTTLLGALWYPPIVFSDEPITLQPRFVLNSKFNDCKILFNSESMIFVISPLKEPSESFINETTMIFNKILAVAQVLGIEGGTVSNKDIIIYKYDKNLTGYSSRRYHQNASVRSLVVENIEEGDQSIYEFSRHIKFTFYRKKTFEAILESAEKITQNKTVTDYLLSFLDAKNHYLIEQYKTSFLLAWLILEKYIDGLWEETLIERKISTIRKEKLIKSNLWTTDDKLETLNLMSTIMSERYDEIIKLKKIRNEIIHRGRDVTKQEVEECLRSGLAIIKELIRDKCFIDV